MSAVPGQVAGGRRCGSGPRHLATDLQQGGDGLELGVGIERFVAHLAAPAGLLVAAEWQCRVEHVVAVDPDGAGPELLGPSRGPSRTACSRRMAVPRRTR